MQPLVPLVFHNLPSLYPPSFRRNDFVLPIFDCAECTIKNNARIEMQKIDVDTLLMQHAGIEGHFFEYTRRNGDRRYSNKDKNKTKRKLKCKTLGGILRHRLWVHCASYCLVISRHVHPRSLHTVKPETMEINGSIRCSKFKVLCTASQTMAWH